MVHCTQLCAVRFCRVSSVRYAHRHACTAPASDNRGPVEHDVTTTPSPPGLGGLSLSPSQTAPPSCACPTPRCRGPMSVQQFHETAQRLPERAAHARQRQVRAGRTTTPPGTATACHGLPRPAIFASSSASYPWTHSRAPSSTIASGNERPATVSALARWTGNPKSRAAWTGVVRDSCVQGTRSSFAPKTRTTEFTSGAPDLPPSPRGSGLAA